MTPRLSIIIVNYNGGEHLLRCLASLAAHPERFAHTVTEKLMVYALGRGLEPYDMPAVRQILRDAAAGGYRMQTIITGIVRSYPFGYRRLQGGSLQASASTPAATTR